MEKEGYRKKIEAAQRLEALRVACAYRTISKNASLVIAGMIPIGLLLLERKYIHERKKAEPKR